MPTFLRACLFFRLSTCLRVCVPALHAYVHASCLHSSRPDHFLFVAYLPDCLSVCLPVSLPVWLPSPSCSCLPDYLHLSANLPVSCMPAYLLACLFFLRSAHLPVCMPACLRACLHVSPSVCLSVCLPACLPSMPTFQRTVCIPAGLTTSCLLPTYLFVCLSVCLFPCLSGFLPTFL
jgi:hypothetical protein